MIVDEDQLRRAVVRIVDRGGRVVGTGFFVTRDLVATCAHVVDKALQEDGVVEIQLLEGMPEGVGALPTTLERESFRDEDAEDVAFLRLKPPLPQGIEPLALATSAGTKGTHLNGFGFPDALGHWMSAKVAGPRGRHQLQLDSSKILPGCSGGPLWDEQGRVVGVAVSIKTVDPKTGRGGDISYAIAAEVLAEVCPEVPFERVERSAAPFLVPFLSNPSFVGRDDDLAAVYELLRERGTVGVRPAALTGMGGIGKTQLAVEYAYRYAAKHPGGVYWVNAVEPLQAELARLAIEVGLDAGEASGSERTQRLALAFAKYLKERPGALAVFDNVQDPLALRSPQAGIIPEQLGCRLLFTTRRRDLPSSFASVEVPVLPPTAAVELLLSTDARRHLLAGGASDERAEADAICRMLGHLPLAVALAAAFLGENPEIALADYRGRLGREGALSTVDDPEVDPIPLPTRHDTAVGATLRLSWQALEGTARKSQDARLLLTTAALLGEAAQVPRARLALLTGLRDEAKGGHAARLASGLRVLHGLSLVEELTEKEIRLHPLVREFAERQIAGREAFAAECAARLGEALRDMGRLHEEVAGRGVHAVLGDLRAGRRLAGASGRTGIRGAEQATGSRGPYVAQVGCGEGAGVLSPAAPQPVLRDGNRGGAGAGRSKARREEVALAARAHPDQP